MGTGYNMLVTVAGIHRKSASSIFSPTRKTFDRPRPPLSSPSGRVQLCWLKPVMTQPDVATQNTRRSMALTHSSMGLVLNRADRQTAICCWNFALLDCVRRESPCSPPLRTTPHTRVRARAPAGNALAARPTSRVQVFLVILPQSDRWRRSCAKNTFLLPRSGPLLQLPPGLLTHRRVDPERCPRAAGFVIAVAGGYGLAALRQRTSNTCCYAPAANAPERRAGQREIDNRSAESKLSLRRSRRA